MAATKSAKNPTSGNDTPDTPGVSETAIAAMKVGELRRELKGRGVRGTADLKKAELVKKLIKLETADAKSTRSTTKKPASVATTRPAKKPASVATSKKLAAAAMDEFTTKKLASAAGRLPTTKKLLFAQTDLPGSDDTAATAEAGESRGGGSRGKSGGGKRMDKAALKPAKRTQELPSTTDLLEG